MHSSKKNRKGSSPSRSSRSLLSSLCLLLRLLFSSHLFLSCLAFGSRFALALKNGVTLGFALPLSLESQDFLLSFEFSLRCFLFSGSFALFGQDGIALRLPLGLLLGHLLLPCLLFRLLKLQSGLLPCSSLLSLGFAEVFFGLAFFKFGEGFGFPFGEFSHGLLLLKSKR